MKKVFIYYSLTGNGDYIANQFKEHEVDVIKLEPVHRLPRLKFFRIFVGGMFACFNKKAKLKIKAFDLSSYDQIILCSPIWCGKTSTPMNTFLKYNSIYDKNVVFISCSASGDASRVENLMLSHYRIKEHISIKNAKDNELNTKELIKHLINEK